MCCLFGIVDPRRVLSVKQKNRMVSALAVAAEARGTDATGIAYNVRGHLSIYKRPYAGHIMRFHLSQDLGAAVIGHTRMQTQGKASRNRNNHPFRGHVPGQDFALAHNGVIWNDQILRGAMELPETSIETDSYIAVQMIEQSKTLSFDSLKDMAEKLRGSFTFTILGAQDDLYIVRGNSPLCLYYYPRKELYLYASTEEILKAALRKFRINEKPQKIPMAEGDILRINAWGERSWGRFDWKERSGSFYEACCCDLYEYPAEDTYLEDLRFLAATFGHTSQEVDELVQAGFAPEEIEEFLYCGEEW